MNSFFAFGCVGLFGLTGGLLFLSLLMSVDRRTCMSDMVKNPRFIGGCICLILTLLCGLAML